MFLRRCDAFEWDRVSQFSRVLAEDRPCVFHSIPVIRPFNDNIFQVSLPTLPEIPQGLGGSCWRNSEVPVLPKSSGDPGTGDTRIPTRQPQHCHRRQIPIVLCPPIKTSTPEADEEELVQRLLSRGRADDNETTIRTRLGVFRNQTEPLISYYENTGDLRRVEGVGTVDSIADRIKAIVA